MAVELETPLQQAARRSSTTDLAIVAGAIGLAVVGGAGLAVGRAAGAAAGRRGRDPGDRLRVLDRPPRDRLADRGVGPVPAGCVRAHRAQDRRRPAGVRDARRLDHPAAQLLRSSASAFVFGPLGDSAQWRTLTQPLGPAASSLPVAFLVAPTIIFVAALFAILYYFGVMQIVVRLFAVLMHRVMRASGAESLNVAASIFMGQTEAPLTIRPYLPEMTQSELMTVMTSGMAHISGGIMAAYILFGVEAKHLLTAVIMTAPGTIMMAKMFVPETEVPKTMGGVRLDVAQTDVNMIDAAARGTSEGLQLALNVLAMLISFIALVGAGQRAARAASG